MKVTIDVYNKVKENRLVTELSKRTIRNIKNSENYSEYRKKYCVKTSNKITRYDINDVIRHCNDLADRLETKMSYDSSLLVKFAALQLLVSVAGLGIIIALIAW